VDFSLVLAARLRRLERPPLFFLFSYPGQLLASGMGFSLWSLFKAGLLVSNAVTVLNPKRFLARYNLTPADMSEHGSPLKNQVIGLLQATQYLKVPLIVLNLLVIIVELLFG